MPEKALIWKTFTADLYEHKHKKNNHDRDQYLYKGKHDAIIPVEKFESAQVLLENRKHHIRGGLPTMQVIDEGIFKGFIPINHHWVNDDPNTYYDISNSVRQPMQVRRIDKRRFSAFNLSGYQVVRGQFMQVRFEGPAITISGERISFNKFCVQKFNGIAYIQLLLHPAERKIAIRPCKANSPHCIKWRPDPEKTICSKTLSCQHFGTALYSIMDWNPEYIYKIRGTWAMRGQEQIIVFNLANAAPAMYIAEDGPDGAAKKRVSLCPEEWDDGFGEEFYEHNLENGFFYLTPNTSWNSQAESILAPGMEQFAGTSPEQLQMAVEDLKGGFNENGDQ